MLSLLLAAGMLTLASGCGSNGPRPVAVSGVVMIDGKPLSAGFIRVVPDGGRPSDSRIGPDGRFTLGCLAKDDGCLIGTHKVEVSGFEDLSPTRRRWLVPKKYASAGTSGLRITIDKPTDALRIDLTWVGSPERGPFVEEEIGELRGGKASGPAGR
jgi:hypothetical protein